MVEQKSKKKIIRLEKNTEIHNEWKSQKLNELADVVKGNGLSKNKISSDGKYKCILYGELFTKYSTIIKKVFSHTNSFEGTPSKNGDILMPSSTTTKGIDLATASALFEENVLLGGDINIIRPKTKKCNSIFLAYYLTYQEKYNIAKISQGITIIHIYGKNIKKLEIKIPSLLEQAKIASIRSNVDALMESTQNVIEKTEMLKKGLAQQLLTKGIGHKKFKKIKWLFRKEIEIPEFLVSYSL